MANALDPGGCRAPRPLTAHEFEQFRKLAHEKFGLNLQRDKEHLVSSRLNKRMCELQIRSYSDYYRYIVGDRTGNALAGMIDALATNHTGFFREPAHFEFFRKVVIPDLAARQSISIWSAAASTGEEPFSIAFCLLQELGMKALPRLRIDATDVSNRALEFARTATYPASRFREVELYRLRPFLRKISNGQEAFLVRKEIRDAVRFRRLNLIEPFDTGIRYPLIFCRNVMIYFDRQTQEDVVRRLAACLEPGGYLLTGHAESLNGFDSPLTYVQPAVYRKPGSTSAR